MENTTFKDYLGQKVNIGDTVIFTAPHYRMFAKGKVIKITNKFCEIEYNNTWNYGEKGHTQYYRCEHKFCIKDTSFTEVTVWEKSEDKRPVIFWFCKRCNTKVDMENKRCQCTESPSPWQLMDEDGKIYQP